MKCARTRSLRRPIFCAAVAALGVWRLPDVMDMPANPWGFGALSALLLAAFTALLLFTPAREDRRLARIACPIGFLFACFSVLGKAMSEKGELPSGSTLEALALLLSIAIYTVLFGAIVFLLYQLALRRLRRPKYTARPAEKKESTVSRLVRNGFFAFGVLLLCWIPVWLAFYPGTFRYDSGGQFSSYVDGAMTTQQPLLHTLLLSWALSLGNAPDSLTPGVALYCGGQMAVMAGICGYACAWLRGRGAPAGLRIAVLALFALMPLYPLWSFSATKDVLFAGFVLLLCLQTADLWRMGKAWFRLPGRMAAYVLTAVVMMLLRNNGVYAFCLTIPFAIIAAKNRRIRTAALLAVCVAGYLGANTLLTRATGAESGSYTEMLSIPLQQMLRVGGRVTATDEEQAMLADLYRQFDGVWPDAYTPLCADSAKWNLDEGVLSENVRAYLALWARLGAANPRLYLEAFLQQNLPYFYPGSKMEYNIVLGLLAMDPYQLEEHSLLPGLRSFYESYDKTLTLFGLGVTEPLSNVAVAVWLALLLLGLASYRRRWGEAIALIFLLAVWVTCLLGPIAVMRYMLEFFYGVPVLTALAFARDGGGGKIEA
jgi:hypothetical protein